MKSHVVSSLIFATLAAIASTGCKSSKPHAAPDEVMPVDVARPTTDSLTIKMDYPASIVADKSVDIVARVNGEILAKYYTNGEHVSKGQRLFAIEDRQYRDAVTQAQASLETAKSQAVYAENQYEALKTALESNAVSKMDVVKAEQAVAQAKAAIESAQAALSTARTNLGYCIVTSPVDGHITEATVSVGDYVSGEGAPVTLATVYDDTTVKARFAIDDSRYLQIFDAKDGDKVNLDNIEVTFNDDAVAPVYGSLVYVAPDVSRSTGTMTAEVLLDNASGIMHDGMYATVHLPVKNDPNAILVHDASIGSDQQGNYMYVVNDDNKVVYTPVVTGDLYNDTLRIIVSGITPQQRYVTKALLKVRDGMTVKPIE